MPFTKTTFKSLFFSAIVLSVLASCSSTAVNDCGAELQLLEAKVRMLEMKVDSLATVLNSKEAKASTVAKVKKSKSQPSSVAAPSYVSSNYNNSNYSSGKSSYTSSRCQATTKKGSQCKRSTRSGSYCWQHGG